MYTAEMCNYSMDGHINFILGG